MKEAVFFDLDMTLVNLATERAFGLYMRNKINQPWLVKIKKLIVIILGYLKYDLHLINDYAILKKSIIRTVMANEDADYYKKCSRDFLNDVIIKNIHKILFDLVNEHKKAGREIYIISAAVDLVVKEIADYFQVTGCFSTELEIKEGKYTGEVVGPVYYGEMRGEIIKDIAKKNNIDLSKSYAYGDYIDDRYMFDLVGHPVVVNPDKKLLKIAKNNDWEIVQFKL